MKKVIFVSGTSFSGSTFLDMILANDPGGFSCGEVYALFHPFRPHHINPECGCGDKDCQIWSQVLKKGENVLYETIFDMFDVDFIVDSSKDLFWFRKHMKILKRKGIGVKNVLIWKTPLELAKSFQKRNRLKEWKKNWTNYHRSYITLIPEYKAVRYSDLTQNESILKDLCDYLGIAYFAQKSQFWQKIHHTLFGNTSAKIHLYSQNSENFLRKKAELVRTSNQGYLNADFGYRSIYYKPVEEDLLVNLVQMEISSDPYLGKIMEVLNCTGKVSRTILMDKLKVPRTILYAKRLGKLLFHRPQVHLKLICKQVT